MPYVHGLSRDPYPVGAVLTSSDPEPYGGHAVRDDVDRVWTRTNDYEGPANWFLSREEHLYYWESDPETWTHVAGNFGPVTVTEAPQDWETEIARDLIDAHG